MNVRALAALLPLLALPACGANLLVVRTHMEARSTTGHAVELDLDYQPPYGLVHDIDSPVLEFLFGILAEPFDVLVSTGMAVDAMFRDDRSVQLGPLGWLLSLTPFATLVPGLEFAPWGRRTLDAATLEVLRDGSPAERAAAARNLLQDDRIVGARVAVRAVDQ